MTWTVNTTNITAPIVKGVTEKTLNGISNFEYYLSGVPPALLSELSSGSTVTIYKDSNIALSGIIKNRRRLQGGNVQIRGHGHEWELARDYQCPTDAGKKYKTYTSTTDDSIFQDVMGEAAGWTADVTESTAATVDSFRVKESDSVWNGLVRLAEHTNKDLEVSWSSKTVSIVDKQGRTSQFSFVEGYNVDNIGVTDKEPEAGKVIVYGKGDGDGQITGSHGSGSPVKVVHDPDIITTAQADLRAEKEYDLINASTTEYELDVIVPTLDVAIGDEGTLDSPSLDISGDTIAVVRTKEHVLPGCDERLEVEVTNTSHRVARKNLAELQYWCGCVSFVLCRA